MKQLGPSVFDKWKPHFLLRLTSVLFIFFIAATTQAQSLIPELSFKNPVLKTGKGCMGDGLDGAVYIFENVGWGIDALVTILGRSTADVTLSETDIQGPEQDISSGTGYDNAWQPRIKYGDGTAPEHTSWWMEFRISFVRHTDHNKLIPVNQFFVSGLDIDGDGDQLHEFQSYYKMHSFSLVHETSIFASTVQGSETDPLLRGKRFDGPTKDYPGISISAQDAMVTNFYEGSSSMIVRLGAETGNSGTKSANRMYGLLFKSLAYDVPTIRKANVNMVAINKIL
ncbi:MAG TPA: hypothetical protein VK711_08935 [Puia sp.]|nr:hypothetical protein [Puia sp.]